MDISSVITANIDAYLKPKYSIYRIKYVKAEITFDDINGDSKLESDYYERICELKDDDDNINNYFDENDNIIYKRFLRDFEGRKSYKVLDNEYEVVTVIGLEKLA